MIGRIDRVVSTCWWCGRDSVWVGSRGHGIIDLIRILVAGNEKGDGGEQEKCCFHSIRIPERFRNAK